MTPPVLRVSLLGGFELRHGPEVVEVRSARIRALVAWLALHGDRPQPRVRVAAALWPESTESQARTNLRNLVHQLRRAFAEIDRYVDFDGVAIAWRPGSPVVVDVAEFERAMAAANVDSSGDASVAARALEEALGLNRGPLLPEQFEPWLTAHRERVRRLRLAGLEALLENRSSSGEYGAVRAVAERMLETDPMNEQAHRARIEALVRLGDTAGASVAFRACETILDAELGVRPSRATLAAYRAALHEADGSPPAPSGATASVRWDATGSPGSDADRPSSADSAIRRRRDNEEGPLVGRERELADLRAAHARAAEHGTLAVWVRGEAGIGKTRLVQALSEAVEREGGRTAHAAAYPTLGALAYGPVITWLRSPTLAGLVAASPAETRAELQRLLPELRSPRASDETERLTESEVRQRLHDAVISVLSHPDAPSVLVLDDLHWADRETIDLLSSILARATGPALVLATIRTGEAGPDHPLERVAPRLAATGRLEILDLEPLRVEETGALVRQVLGRDVSAEDVRALHRETEGNPLFIVETARSGRRWGEDGALDRSREAPSPRIRAVIEGRLRLLSAEARALTQVAATIGREFTTDLLVEVSPLQEAVTLRALEEAWGRRLVRERPDGSWDFSHGKVREVAYRTTSPVRRRAYHARIGRVLERAVRGGGLPAAVTLDQVALHHDLGGSVVKAVEWYRRAARAAVDVSGLDAVRQLLSRALELLDRLPHDRVRDEQELEMRLSLGSALVALEGYGRAETVATYDRALELCNRLERDVTPPVLRALALAALARGDLAAGTRFGLELTAAADRDSDPVARVEGAYVLGVMAFWQADLVESERRLSDAVAWYGEEHHRSHARQYAQDPGVACRSRLAWTLWHRGRVTEALARRDEALALAERQGDPWGLAYGLWFTLFIAIEAGDLARVEAQATALKRIATAHRLLYADTVADGFLGYLDAAGGDARAGIERMRHTLADQRWIGMQYVLKLQTLYLMAKASAGAGDWHTARATVDEALDYIGGKRSIWTGPLLHIEARAVGAEDRTGERALTAFAAAVTAARSCGSAWTELCTAVDLARWTLGRRNVAPGTARADLQRALAAYADAPAVPAVAAGRMLLERLTEGGGP